MSDLRHAFRQIASRPTFSAIVICTLALGIGANSAFFSIINAALLRPAAVSSPATLMNVYTSKPDGSGHGALSYPDYRDLRSRDAFDDVAGYSGLMTSLSGNGPAEVLFGEIVTGNYFSVLGVKPQLGRFFLPFEDRTELTHPVVVIGDRLWRRRFGSDPGIVGKSIVLNSRHFTVIGIAPREFTGSLLRGFSVDVYAPVMMMGALRTSQLNNRDERWMFVKGRLHPNSNVQQARAALDVISLQLASAYPASNKGRAFRLVPSSDVRVSVDADGAVVPAAAFMLVAVGLVLLVACTNLASLMLARAASRQREVAIRTALGARRWRIVRQLLTESAVLAVGGGTGGLLLATWLAKLLVAFKPPLPVAINFDVSVDFRVIVYTVLLTLVTTLFFGLLPALHATRGDLTAAMRHQSGAGSTRGRRYGLRNIMLVPQVSLSLVLLVIAGLFGRSVSAAGNVNTGFDVDRTALVALNLAPNGYDEARSRHFYDELQRRLGDVPGVTATAVMDRIPLDLYGNQTTSLQIDGSLIGATDAPSIQYARIQSSYFETLGVRILRGRNFSPGEIDNDASVVIVSDAAARQYWPGANPIGQRIRLDGNDSPLLEVIGVSADVKVQTLGEAAVPFVYRPLTKGYPRLLRLVVHTTSNPENVVHELRRLVAEADPDVALFEVKTMHDHVSTMLFPFRAAAALSSALGMFALLLAAVGLYGVLSFAVEERTRELAIRIALGAQRNSVLSLVAADGVRVVTLGVIIGLMLALGISRLLASWLFGISATDLPTFVIMPLTLLSVSVIASIAPALRATSVDPMLAMRE